MALKKDITNEAGITGNYWKLVLVQLPTLDSEKGIGQTILGFNIYRDEAARKSEGRSVFMTKTIVVPASFLAGFTLPDSFNSAAQAIYAKKAEIPGLEDADDIVDTATTETAETTTTA